ncbi:MAG TPA: NHLP bacteriocin system secretion protein [Gemmatimonadaceae bacterium]|nr:NHLP bacteriocin system secretion protein [Gemmatimonadaceae bacterium]
MTQSSAIFRKVSLDRLASPEQLDQLMRVTDLRGWVALAATGVVLATALAWGVAGRIPENVSGTGMLVKSGGIFQVTPSAGGRVVDVAVDVGDDVAEGQVVARVAQPELDDRIRSAKAELENLHAEHAKLVQFTARDAVLQQAYIDQQRTSIEQSKAAAEQSLGWLQERINSQEQLVQQGLLTRSTLVGTRQQYDQLREKIADAAGQLTQLKAKSLGIRNDHDDRLRQSEAQIDQRSNELAELERQRRTGTDVIAPYGGRVLEIMTDRGNLVSAGEPIMSINLGGRAVQELEAVIFIPSVQGKRIRPGMTIQVAPTTVKQEEFGLMVGKVTYVSDFPATARGMQRVLKNDKLAGALAGSDAPYELHAELVPDPNTTSRYKWTSSKGPPIRIQSGTLATGNVEVASRRPIEMVLPLLRRATGL